MAMAFPGSTDNAPLEKLGEFLVYNFVALAITAAFAIALVAICCIVIECRKKNRNSVC